MAADHSFAAAIPDRQTELAIADGIDVSDVEEISSLPIDEQVVELEKLHAHLRLALDQSGAN